MERLDRGEAVASRRTEPRVDAPRRDPQAVVTFEKARARRKAREREAAGNDSPRFAHSAARVDARSIVDETSVGLNPRVRGASEHFIDRIDPQLCEPPRGIKAADRASVAIFEPAAAKREQSIAGEVCLAARIAGNEVERV